jgi:hypothetical protein
MATYYPEAEETLHALVRRILPGLTPEVRARVRVVTGGERAGLVVPGHATPVAVTPAVRPPRSEPPAPAPEPDEPQLAARRPRRRTTTKETT